MQRLSAILGLCLVFSVSLSGEALATCTAEISSLTSKFELVYVPGTGAGKSLAGARYENHPGTTNQSASFLFTSTCASTVLASISPFTDATGHTISTTPTIGIDGSAYGSSPAGSPMYSSLGAVTGNHNLVADIELPSSMKGLPAGEYDAVVTLTVTAP